VPPENKFPLDYPFGTDLDNLLKRLLDGLSQTVLSEAKGRDSTVIAIRATKRMVGAGQEPGARIALSAAEFPT